MAKKKIGEKIRDAIDRIEDTVQSVVHANDARYWPVGDGFRHPELDLPEISARRSVGVCFSGGGTRSASAVLGQLRALHSLGVMDRVRYISAISGGSWASAPYTFLPSRITTDSFLGPYVPPASLTLRGLGVIDEASNRLAHVISRSKITARILKHYFTAKGTTLSLNSRGKRADETFGRAVGEIMLKPFGLFEGAGTQKFFTWSRQTRDAILARNPHLENDDFYMVTQPRPFLIAGGVIHRDVRFAQYELTPLYVGSSQRHRNLFGQEIGGGYVEPIAHDSFAPADRLEGGRAKARLGQAFHRLSLSDMIGTSGAAPSFFSHVLKPAAQGLDAAALAAPPAKVLTALLNIFTEIFPRFGHWPVREGERVDRAEFDFGDGAYVDSFGIIPLLKRRVRNIVCFINSDIPLEGDSLGDFRAGGRFGISGSLPLLFGENALATDWMSKLLLRSGSGQVFDNTRAGGGTPWQRTLQEMISARDAGQPVCASMTYTTVRNDFYGIPGGDQVKVLWFYLNRTQNWEDAIGDRAIKDRLTADRAAGRLKSPDFKHFPHYRTFLENPGATLEAVDLTPEQVSLLSHLSAWCVLQKGEEIRAMCA